MVFLDREGLAEFERDLILARTGKGRERAKERRSQARPSKLTTHQCDALKALADCTASLADSARRFNVSQSTIQGCPRAAKAGGMAEHRNREEAVNTQLAILISRYGVTADGETIHVHGKHRPDVLFQLRGLRVVIEGKFADHPNAAGVVLKV